MNNTENNQTNINNENLKQNAPIETPKKKKSKSKGAIIALAIALVLCILVIIALVVMGVLGVLGVGIAGIFMFNKTEAPEAPEVSVVETVQTTTEVPTTEEIITTEPAVSEVYGDYVTSPEVTHNYVPDYYYGANSFYITYDTPAHAGVNLRETPEDDSVKIMVLPEGTTVTRLYEAGETAETKYILVCVEVDGVEYTGYVMQRYVSTSSGASFDSYVSYNTPSHAGLVLRETADGNSKKIMVIPEGTELRVVDNTTGAYWAVDAFYNGEIYSGYVLGKYVETIY